MRDVVVINQFALPRTEGGGTRHVDLFGRLSDWRPLILAGNRNHYTQERFSTADDRFRLIRVPSQDGGGLQRLVGWIAFAAQALFVTACKRRLDLVYGSSPQPFAALAGLMAARVRRKPFVLEVRDLWPESIVAAGHLRRGSLTHRVFSCVEQLLVSSASRVICVTEGWEEHFKKLGLDENRLVVIPNGTELGDFAVPRSRAELRRQYGIDGFTAVFAGAHGPMNGLDLTLDAAIELPQINFLFVGAGPAKADAIQRVRREGIANVEFRDPVSKAELPALLKACDVGIHALSPLSVFDKGASPNKLFDYMAAGLPIVSNMAEGVSRIAKDGECGRIGGAESLPKLLRSVYDASPEQRDRWGKAASEIVAARYSRSIAASRLQSALSDVLNPERVASPIVPDAMNPTL